MRNVLIICGRRNATAHVRADQYKELFESSPTLRAQLIVHEPERFKKLDASLSGRWWSVPAARALRRCESQIKLRHEDQIIKFARNFDVVYLVRVPSWRLHKRLWDSQKAKIVMDLNDGLWLPYHRTGGFEELECMMRHSHAIACENERLAEYANRHNSNVTIVPDCPQIEDFDSVQKRFKPRSDRVTLGWVGGPVAADNLGAIYEPLEALFAHHNELHLRILGADIRDLPRFENVRFSCKPVYSNWEMIEEVLQMDIGLFPLYRTQDSKTRGSLKARIYMAGGVVAACQNWGDSTQLIRHRQNGVLAGTPDEWITELEWLIDHPVERKAIAARGLETIRSSFTRAACFAKLASVLESV